MSNPDVYYDPPDERMSRCECGHSYEDHVDDEDFVHQVFYDQALGLSTLRQIRDCLVGQKRVPEAMNIIREWLNVCTICDDCQAFVEATEREDGDYAFDSARDKSLGG